MHSEGGDELRSTQIQLGRQHLTTCAAPYCVCVCAWQMTDLRCGASLVLGAGDAPGTAARTEVHGLTQVGQGDLHAYNDTHMHTCAVMHHVCMNVHSTDPMHCCCAGALT